MLLSSLFALKALMEPKHELLERRQVEQEGAAMGLSNEVMEDLATEQTPSSARQQR